MRIEEIVGDAGFEEACEQAIQELHDEEREALRRVANGISGVSDAVLLAGSLGHSDLFMHRGQK